jgi:hypothetical protein
MALKPLSIGEIVDRSTSFWRSHWKTLFQLLLGFQLVQYVLIKALEVAIDRLLPAAKNPSQVIELMKTDPALWTPKLGPLMGSMVVVLVLNFLASQVSGVVLTAFTYPRLTDTGAPTVGQAFQTARQRLAPTIGLFALSLVWTLLVGLLFLLPGALTMGGGVYLAVSGSGSAGAAVSLAGGLVSVLGVVALVLWFLIRFVLASQVLAVEPLGAVAAFKRTDALSSGRVGAGVMGLVKGRLTVLITIVAFILTVVGVVTGLPELIVKAVFGELTLSGAPTGFAPQALVVPAQLLQVVAGAVITPLYIVFQVVFYVDMRVRREGLDLELASSKGPA